MLDLVHRGSWRKVGRKGFLFLVKVFSSSYTVAVSGWLPHQLAAVLPVEFRRLSIAHRLGSFTDIPAGSLLVSFTGMPVVGFLANFTSTLAGRIPASFSGTPAGSVFCVPDLICHTSVSFSAIQWSTAASFLAKSEAQTWVNGGLEERDPFPSFSSFWYSTSVLQEVAIPYICYSSIL